MNKKDKIDLLLLFSVLVCSVTWFFYRMYVASDCALFEANDEAEKFVAAMMLNSGSRLYSDIFAHHGPMTYILAHAISLLGIKTVSAYRLLFVVICFFMSLVAAWSPVLKGWRQKILCISVFLVLLGSFGPTWRAHMFLYNNIAGMGFFVLFAYGVFPAITSRSVSRWSLRICGFFSGVCFWSAYSYSLAIFVSFLLIYFGSKNNNEKPLFSAKNLLYEYCAGFLLTSLLVALWLLINGSFVGYFVYHLYFNQFVYSKFINFELKNMFEGLFSSFSGRHSFILAVMLVFNFLSIIYASFRNKRLLFVNCILTLFLCSALNPTSGGGLKIAALATSMAGFFSLSFVVLCYERNVKKVVRLICTVLVLGLFCVEVLFNSGESYDDSYIQNSLLKKYPHVRPEFIPDVRVINEYVPEGEKILIYPFSPKIYLYTDRLPASSHYYYLPWQAAYDEAPILGHKIDIISDIEKNKPKAIILGDRQIWGRYKFSDYAPEIQRHVNLKYRQTKWAGFYLRRDL